jgi:hypothetical protein
MAKLTFIDRIRIAGAVASLASLILSLILWKGLCGSSWAAT